MYVTLFSITLVIGLLLLLLPMDMYLLYHHGIHITANKIGINLTLKVTLIFLPLTRQRF